MNHLHFAYGTTPHERALMQNNRETGEKLMQNGANMNHTGIQHQHVSDLNSKLLNALTQKHPDVAEFQTWCL